MSIEKILLAFQNLEISLEVAMTDISKITEKQFPFPKNDKEITCFSLLQKISKLEQCEQSPYEPENVLRTKKIEYLKNKYYKMLEELCYNSK